MCGADIDGLVRTANSMDNDPCGMPLWSIRRGDLITLLARATSIKICPNHDALKHVKDPLSDAIDVCGTRWTKRNSEACKCDARQRTENIH